MPGRRPRSVPFSARSSNEFACSRTRTFVFDPGDPQLRERVLAVIAPKKIDLVIDSIGGTLLNQLVSMLGECVPSTEVWLKLVPTSDVP